MSLVISKVFTYDTDAGNYIQAVEAADGQALEAGTRQAINNFVVGCKQDGIWSAIKASCILSGARTLNGALQPLAGTAPTNFNFVTGDYNRKTGLGDPSNTTKRLEATNVGVLKTSNHGAVYVTVIPTSPFARYFMGDGSGSSFFQTYRDGANAINNRNGGNGGNYTITGFSEAALPVGIVGNSNSSGVFTGRAFGRVRTNSADGGTASNLALFADLGGGNNANGRFAFYSFGESLDLALLDARVTALITAFGVAIP
jgi:hypothetical protein